MLNPNRKWPAVEVQQGIDMSELSALDLARIHFGFTIANMKAQAHKVRHPLMVRRIAVLLGICSFVCVAAWMATLTDMVAVAHAVDNLPAPSVRAKCSECGVITSMREIEQPGDATRDGQNEMPPKSSRRYEITVHMKNGSSHVFTEVYPATWRPGERVIVIEGTGRSNELAGGLGFGSGAELH